jgi:putative transposase
MPRTARIAPGGIVFHVLNRAVAGAHIFETDGDYAAFVQVLAETLQQKPIRVCAFCLMPNHWHFLLWPEEDGQLAAFMHRLTLAHVRKWQEYRGATGMGHLYQGRYKSFPVESDEHFLTVARYVERNPLRAGLVSRAQDWQWSSLWLRRRGTAQYRAILSPWPMPVPPGWVEWVDQPEGEQELKELRASVGRGRPFGSTAWQKRVARQLGLASAYRDRGRPRKTRRP